MSSHGTMRTMRTMRALLWVLAVVAVWMGAAPADAQRLDEIFDRANQAYFEGNYRRALRDYNLLVESGVDDPDVSYNLAVSHGRIGEYGQAIRYFERTLRLRPDDPEAEEGLRAAQGALERRLSTQHANAIVESEPSFGEAVVRGWSEGALAWIVLMLNALVLVGVMVFRFTQRETARLALGIAIPLLGVCLVIASLGLAIKAGVFRDGEMAIVTAQEGFLREGPDERAVSRGPALEGERAQIVDQQGQWVRVQLGAGRQGWMHEAEVGSI